VKTQRAGKGLVGAVVNCELWRLAIALSLVITSCVYKESISPVIKSKPLLIDTPIILCDNTLWLLL
jgi:hypothetical protein